MRNDPPGVRRSIALQSRRRGVGIVVVATAIVAAACAPPPPPPPPPPPTVDWEVDTSLEPEVDSIPGPAGTERPVAVLLGEGGTPAQFVEDEIIVEPADASDLSGFLARHRGEVVGTDAVPAPPPGSGIIVPAELSAPKRYTVRVDPSTFPTTGLGSDSAALGVDSAFSVSSARGAGLLALVARERREGRQVSVVMLAEPQFLEETGDGAGTGMFERNPNPSPEGQYRYSAMRSQAFADTSASGSRIQSMWQLVDAVGTLGRVQVAVLDAGFWVDATGVPADPPVVGGDFALGVAPLQYDFVNDDHLVGEPNPILCNGSMCPWHGHNSAAVAVGLLDDGRGGAGSGGQVADPILLDGGLSSDIVLRGIRTAKGWGAEVINMSFSMSCDDTCQAWAGWAMISDELSSGIVAVASAGNQSSEVGSGGGNDRPPCTIRRVICVGALAPGTNRKADYSNFGPGVDIYAPSDIWVGADPTTRCGDLPASTCMDNMSGTSAAAPLVAGVAAVMLAYAPGIDVEAVLRQTANSNSPDLDVLSRGYLNALKAVEAAMGDDYPLAADRFEPNDTVPAGPLPWNSDFGRLTIDRADDADRFLVQGAGPGELTLRVAHPHFAEGVRTWLAPTAGSGGCGELEQIAPGWTNSPSVVRSTRYRVPAGNLLATVRGNGRDVMPYGLSFTRSPVAPDRFDSDPAQPDRPRNDTRDTASWIDGSTEHLASFDPVGAPTDLDHYLVRSSGAFFQELVGGVKFSVGVAASDVPVVVEVFDSRTSTTPIRSATSGPGCENQVLVDLPPGFHWVRIRPAEPGAIGHYRFYARERTVSGRLFDLEALWRILLDPSIPVQFNLRDDVHRAYTVADEVLRSAGGMQIRSAEPDHTDSRLLDGDGNLLQEGLRTPTGERFDTSSLTPGEAYVIETVRTPDADPGVSLPVTVSLEDPAKPVPPSPTYRGSVPGSGVPVGLNQLSATVAIHSYGYAPNEPVWITQCVNGPYGLPEFNAAIHCMPSRTLATTADENGRLDTWFTLLRLQQPEVGNDWVCGAAGLTADYHPLYRMFTTCEIWVSTRPPGEPPPPHDYFRNWGVRFSFITPAS
jgi:hypothetical protein